MNSKEYLSQALHLDRKVNSLLIRLEKMKALACRYTETLKQTPGGCGEKRSLEDAVMKIVLAEEELGKEAARLFELKAEILGVISQLDDSLIEEVLTMRYIDGMRWNDIGIKLNYTTRYMLMLHAEGLERIQKILDER